MNLKSILIELITQSTQSTNRLINEAEMKHRCGRVSFNREFRTVGLLTARQIGKTNTIKDMYRPGDLILVHSEEAKRNYQQGWNVQTISKYEDNHPSLRGLREAKKYGYIFFDEIFSCHFNRSSIIQNVYEYTDADFYISLST